MQIIVIILYIVQATHKRWHLCYANDEMYTKNNYMRLEGLTSQISVYISQMFDVASMSDEA